MPVKLISRTDIPLGFRKHQGTLEHLPEIVELAELLPKLEPAGALLVTIETDDLYYNSLKSPNSALRMAIIRVAKKLGIEVIVGNRGEKTYVVRR